MKVLVCIAILEIFWVPKTYCKVSEIKSDKTQISSDQDKYSHWDKSKEGVLVYVLPTT